MDLGFLLFDSPVFTWVILPLLIFCSRIFDQTAGTLRLVFVSKGYKNIVPIFAFLESIIWLLAIGEVMKHLNNAVCYIAYAGGYAAGNYIGMIIDEKLSLGTVIIRVILTKASEELVHKLRNCNYGLTVVDAEGSIEKVKILFSTVKRKDAKGFIAIVNEYNPHAFYTVEEVRTVNEGIFRRNGRRSLISAQRK
jgi:uncharacterized protein YebE (UPF0316 family)